MVLWGCDWWYDYIVVYYVLYFDYFVKLFLVWIREYLELMKYFMCVVGVVEILGLILVIIGGVLKSMCFFGILLLVGLYIGFFVIMVFGLFLFVLMMCWVFFIFSWCWDWVEKKVYVW